MGKRSCFNVRTVTPAGNFNSDYNSLEIKRSYGPFLAAGSQLLWQLLFLTFPSCGSAAAQHSVLPTSLHTVLAPGSELSG